MDGKGCPNSTTINREGNDHKFIGTLQSPYYKEMAKRTPKSFGNVVILYGMMDEALKRESNKGKKKGKIKTTQ